MFILDITVRKGTIQEIIHARNTRITGEQRSLVSFTWESSLYFFSIAVILKIISTLLNTQICTYKLMMLSVSQRWKEFQRTPSPRAHLQTGRLRHQLFELTQLCQSRAKSLHSRVLMLPVSCSCFDFSLRLLMLKCPWFPIRDLDSECSLRNSGQMRPGLSSV